jgi:glycosyltransferase involved in cell wall biosynthesis
MPVYNGAVYLEEAIDCILDQTYGNFEFIIINDGSTDGSAGIIGQYNDPRIRYYEHENRGLAATLNRGIELSRGKYIARQDQDDISLPGRFAKQINFLETNPEHGMVGTWAEIWIGNEKAYREHRHPTDNLVLQFDLLFTNPFVHSSMMIRRAVFDEIGLYATDKTRQPPEDYELWSRVAKKFRVGNIPEILQIYREIPKSMSRDTNNPMFDRAIAISRENMLWILGTDWPEEDIGDLAALSYEGYHLLSGGCGLRRLLRTITEAANRLSDMYGVSRNVLRTRARAHFKPVRNRYLSHKYKRVSGPLKAFMNLMRSK